MSGFAGLISGGVAVMRRDARIHFSSRLAVVSHALTALFSLTLFYYVSRLVGVERFPDPDDYFAFVVIGLVILQALTASLATLPLAVRAELSAGTFERVAVSPFGLVGGIVAMAAWPLAWALVNGALTLVLAVVIFGLPLAFPDALLAVPAAGLAVLAFLPFALLVAALVLVSKQAGNLGRLLVVAMSLVGGVYFPPALLPGTIEWLAYVQPFTPALDLLRHLLLGGDAATEPAVAVARLAAFALVMTPVALAAVTAAARWCRRRGTLLET